MNDDPRIAAIEASPLSPILGEIQHGFRHRMYWTAITLCLTLPDICAAAELAPADDDFFKAGPRYKRWVERWMPDAFGLTPEDIWHLRGGLIHKGQTFGHPHAQYSRVIFALPQRGGVNGLVVVREGELPTCTISVDIFCDTIIQAVMAWNLHVADNAQVQEALAGLVRYRPDGFGRDVVGVPVIA